MKELNERQFHQEVALDSFKLCRSCGTFEANYSEVTLSENFELNRAVGMGFLFGTFTLTRIPKEKVLR